MIIVTGGAGFIGSNIVKALNDSGENDIVVVDNLSNGRKFYNMVDLDIADYWSKEDFIAKVRDPKESIRLGKEVQAILHQGACSSTTEWDGKYMMDNNFEYSKSLLHLCLEQQINFIYASSAATYGGNTTFVESPEFEAPLNVYGYSKLLFDNYVRRILGSNKSQIAGFRYFNVYGPREQHKGSMSSVAFHFNNQIKENGECRLFAGSGGYGDGEQLRDFISVRDVVNVNLWFLDNPDKSGIFNVGTGRAQSFNDVANAVIKWHGKGEKKYIPFPDHLKGAYQSYTQADISALRDIGYSEPFATVEEGVKDYLDTLNAEK